jgi:hypothetical protein
MFFSSALHGTLLKLATVLPLAFRGERILKKEASAQFWYFKKNIP